MESIGTADFRARRRRRVERAARTQDGVLGRRQLYGLGLSRGEVRAEIRAGRWVRTGGQSVQVLPPVSGRARFWRAVLEVGPTAVVDGVSALIVAGLTGIDSPSVHVAVPKSADPRRCRGVTVHETRRYRAEDVVAGGLPRMKPATAAVHAALWARSDKQAALFLVAAVQQGLVTAAELGTEIDLVRRDRRRRLLRDVLTHVTSGVESMGELEFSRLCAARGLPEPDRQILRTAPSGRVYFDVGWRRYAVDVEIDGAQHRDVQAVVPDALKQNAASIEGVTVLRIPVLALRTDPGPFMEQVEAALRRGGWPGPARRLASG
jgi:hypothetical protein